MPLSGRPQVVTLATASDVEAALGRTLLDTESDRVNQLLEIASEAVRTETGGFRFSPGTYTVRRIVRHGRIRLPARVDSVSTVSAVDPETGAASPILGWTAYGSTVYGVAACTAEVTFTVTKGVPSSIAALVAGVVSATMSTPQTGAKSAGAGPFTFSFMDGSGRVWFCKSDKAILALYRLPKSAIELL